MNLCIELGQDSYTLKFRVLDNPIAGLWLDRMRHRGDYPLDDVARFSGFDSQEQEHSRVQQQLQMIVDQLNLYGIAVARPVDAESQDYLNYLHNIFERQHGLLDQQTTNPITTALSNLNIAIHRAESINRGQFPRFVCTWFGMPKTHVLDPKLMTKHGVLVPGFGSVCLNYAEIGKTLEDLTLDRDSYISPEAFRPFNHYSADFNVKFFEPESPLQLMEQYYHEHQQFFEDLGYKTFHDPRLLPLHFPVAELILDVAHNKLIQDISTRQCINKIYFDGTM